MRGLLLVLFFPAVGLAIHSLAVLVPVPVVCIAIPAALLLALHLLLARGAARAASEIPADRPRPFFSRWYSCVAAVVLTAGVSSCWTHGYRNTFVQGFRIPTGAMEPTVLIGDHILVVKWAHGWRDPAFGYVLSEARPPRRGDLVVFRYPDDRSRLMLKRCVGLPGETVAVRGGILWINGRRQDEPYISVLEPLGGADSGEADPRHEWGPQTVPGGHYFLLGDNRDSSRDSRFWGFLPQDDLVGRATVVYWSYEARRGEVDATTSGIEWIEQSVSRFGRTRWGRIGHRLR